MGRMVARLLTVPVAQRLSAKSVLELEVIKACKAAKWYRDPAMGNREMEDDTSELIKTIDVGGNIAKLSERLPTAMFPDQKAERAATAATGTLAAHSTSSVTVSVSNSPTPPTLAQIS